MARIYVADLSAYNAGHLHGVWIDLEGKDVDDVQGKINAMLKAGTQIYCPVTLSVHEEYAIHDYEGFGPIRIGEYDSLDTVLGHVERMGEDPNRYYAWLAERGNDEAENYDPSLVHGPYASESEFVDDYLENAYGAQDIAGILSQMTGQPESHFEGLAAMLQWRDTDDILRDWGNPLTEVRNADYSREFYEVEQS